MECTLLISDGANFGIFLKESFRITEEEALFGFYGTNSFGLVGRMLAGCQLVFDAVSDLHSTVKFMHIH